MPQLDQLITLYITLLIFFTTVTFSSTNTTDSLFITLKQLELDFKDQIRHFLLSKTGVHMHEKSIKPNKFKTRRLKLLIYFEAKKKKILTIYGQYIIFLLTYNIIFSKNSNNSNNSNNKENKENEKNENNSNNSNNSNNKENKENEKNENNSNNSNNSNNKENEKNENNENNENNEKDLKDEKDFKDFKESIQRRIKAIMYWRIKENMRITEKIIKEEVKKIKDSKEKTIIEIIKEQIKNLKKKWNKNEEINKLDEKRDRILRKNIKKIIKEEIENKNSKENQSLSLIQQLVREELNKIKEKKNFKQLLFRFLRRLFEKIIYIQQLIREELNEIKEKLNEIKEKLNEIKEKKNFKQLLFRFLRRLFEKIIYIQQELEDFFRIKLLDDIWIYFWAKHRVHNYKLVNIIIKLFDKESISETIFFIITAIFIFVKLFPEIIISHEFTTFLFVTVYVIRFNVIRLNTKKVQARLKKYPILILLIIAIDAIIIGEVGYHILDYIEYIFYIRYNRLQL